MTLQRIDFTGREFGLLRVRWRSIGASDLYKWNCICRCGSEKNVSERLLRSGKVRSCGCVPRNQTHGGSKTREFAIWQGMHKRCRDPKASKFHLYGGRGIKVCSRWGSFENFLADMGPSDGLVLDRKEWDGDYEPSNCRWANWFVNENNTARVWTVTVGDRILTVAEFGAEMGISRQAAYQRLRDGRFPKVRFHKRSESVARPPCKVPRI